jgi:nitrite reductase/ring-hydroxylating ferredoxin subunit
MLKKLVIIAGLISLTLILTACANSKPTATTPLPASTPEPTQPANPEPASTVEPKPRPSGPIKATWLQAQVDQDGQTVSLPVSELEDNWNIHFKLKTTQGDVNFMAYIFDGEIYVRANVCPPCKSIGFSLDEEAQQLICDRCATLFNASTGVGIKGACVDYPKAAAPYEIRDGNLVIKGSDLITAYQDTLSPG